MRVFKNPHSIAAFFYGAITFFVFWPILWPGPGTLVFGDDIHRSYHFFRQLFGSAIARGEFPWWNPYLFSGEPFIANPSLAFWYPINWLFALIPYRFVYSWIIPLHIFWAMMGMYYLISNFKFQISNFEKKDSKQFNVGGFIAGLIFGLSGFFMGRVWEGHVELILSASWMPWVVYAFGVISNLKAQNSKLEVNDQKREERRAVVIAGIVLAMQILAGYQTMALFTLEAVIIMVFVNQGYLLWLSSRRTPGSSGKKILDSGSWAGMTFEYFQPLIRVTIAIILGLFLAAIQLIPSQEFFRASIRTYALPYSWAVFGSYTVDNLKQLIDPFIFGFPWSYKGPSPNFGEMAAYVGKLGPLLALIPVGATLLFVFTKATNRIRNYELGIMKKSNAHAHSPQHSVVLDRHTVVFVWSMAAIAVFGLWVSFGWNAPVDLNKILWDIVPTYKYLRIPSRHLILFVFGMSALAGLGFHQIMMIVSFARPGLAKLSVFILSAVIIVDMLWFVKIFVTLRPDPATRHNVELVGFLQKNLGMARILPNFNVGMGTRDALDFDAAMGYRMMSASGYDPAILHNYYEFAAAVAGIENPDVQQTDVQIPYLLPTSRYVDFLNVKYFFVPSWFDSVGGSHGKYKLVMEENKKDYFRLYENTRVLPRFFLASTLIGKPNRDAIARAIRAGEYDPGTTVLVHQKDLPSGLTADCGVEKLPGVMIVSYSMNTIVLTTDAPCKAMLATSEVMYPGWTATIDGQPTAIIEGNLAFRTIAVPKGRHTIVMSYRPTVFLIGFIVTIATLLGSLIWMRKVVF